MTKTNYLIGTEPDHKPAETPQEDAEQQNAGLSGTTHSRSKTRPEDAHSRIKALQESLRN